MKNPAIGRTTRTGERRKLTEDTTMSTGPSRPCGFQNNNHPGAWTAEFMGYGDTQKVGAKTRDSVRLKQRKKSLQGNRFEDNLLYKVVAKPRVQLRALDVRVPGPATRRAERRIDYASPASMWPAFHGPVSSFVRSEVQGARALV